MESLSWMLSKMLQAQKLSITLFMTVRAQMNTSKYMDM